MRRVAGVVVVGLVLPLLAAVAPPPALSATAGTVTNLAGGLGQGAATNLAITPAALAWRNGRLVIGDDRFGLTLAPLDTYPGVLRSLDPATGVATVLAGLGGRGGYSGDGGPSDKAELRGPAGLAVDSKGNLYVADSANNRVRRIGPDGTISTFAGNGSAVFSGDGGPATSAGLSFPTDVAVAPDGSVLIVDRGNGRLRRVSPSGTISTVAGAGGPLPVPAPSPPGLADVRPTTVGVDGNGAIYFLDGGSGKLMKLSGGGTLSEVPTGLQWSPTAVAVERAGTLLVAGEATLRRVDPSTGRIDVLAGTAGQPGFAGDGGPATAALIGDVRDVVADDAGGIYLADRADLRIRRIGPDGTITTVAGNGMAFHGGDGGPASSAQLTGAENVTATAAGVYFTERDATDRLYRLERVGSDGVLRTLADLPSEEAAGMAVDGGGSVYLSQGDQVTKWSPGGGWSVVAGAGVAGLSGDGGPAVGAQLQQPRALALDGKGNLYIADDQPLARGGPRVRRVDQAGTISTFAGGAPADSTNDSRSAVAALAAHFATIIDLAIDGRGSLVVAGRTEWVTASLWRVTCGMAGMVANTYLPTLESVAVDGAGAMYITSSGSAGSRIVSRVDRWGGSTVIAGGGTDTRYAGRPATSVNLQITPGPSVDGVGNVVLGTGSGIVRVEQVAAPQVPPGVPCGIVPDHPAFAWGWNVFGELGDGTTHDAVQGAFEDPPVTGAVAVTGGGFHSLALKADGTVWAWGWNGFGQLGDGTTAQRNRAVQVAGLTGVTAIAAGAFDSMALKADGTVWAWGWNGFGQLGDGTTTDRWRPVQVAGLRNVKAISANVVHSLAVTTDGTAWSWGWNGFGLLGDGTTAERHVPGRVVGLAGVTSVAAGYYHSVALKADGSVWGWGWNAQGQLGDGTKADARVPVRAVGVSGATAVSAGNNHTVAIVGGKVWGWGWNALNQLGSSTPPDRAMPAPVSFTSGVVAVALAAGAYHTVILTDTNFVMAWGWDQFGQSNYELQPDHPVAIGAGSYTSMAIYQFTP